jgi:hypothetical protein
LSNQKVVKFRKRKSLNIGVIVFLILFIYIAINVYFYFTNDHLSIYEVHEGNTAIDNRITGLILRDEAVVYSEQAGYVSYYQKEGARVAKNEAVYSIDENGSMNDILATGDVSVTLTSKNCAELKRNIKDFRNSYSDQNFSYVYEFKDDTESTVLDIMTGIMLDNNKAFLEEAGQTLSYRAMTSENSGIISYYMDGYETVTPDTVTADIFQPDQCIRTSLRTADILDRGKPIYKLITSDEWKLVLLLNEEQYKRLSGKEQISFTILEDELEMTAPLSLSQSGSQYKAVISLNKYLSNYLEERYLDVELDFDTVKGLKIPLTSIVEKDFYLVPKEYISMGANSTDSGLIVESYDNKTGEAIYNFTPTTIYYEDDAYAYIDADQFTPGTFIHLATQNQRYTLGPTNKLIGVYNVNQGYAVFKRIEILYQNEEYCIISDKTKGGLAAYDHIVLDGSTAINQAIIN